MLGMSGCSDPLNYEVARLTRDRQANIQALLTAEQTKMLDDWVSRQTQGGKPVPAGITVDAALRDQQQWLADRKSKEEQAAQAEARRRAAYAARQQELSRVVTVAALSKSNKVLPDDRRFVSMPLSYGNRSDKRIRTIKGVLRIVDVYGEPVISIDYAYTRGIPAKATVTDPDEGLIIDDATDSHISLWNTDFGRMKVSSDITTIEFTDGTSLTDAIP